MISDVDLMHMPPSEADLERFKQLQAHLPVLWRAVNASSDMAHTSVVIPSISFDPDELQKIDGVSCYEERLLFCLIRLRHPAARVLYVSSQPVHPEIIDYYLNLLAGVPASHARRRLGILHLYDGSSTPLTQRILERPRVIARMKSWIGDPTRAYLTCFNSTRLEQRLALALGIPLNGVDPALLPWGSKSGSRKAFAMAGVAHPAGVDGVRDRDDVLDALTSLARGVHPPKQAVLKLNESFSGEGNAVFRFPSPLPADEGSLREALMAGLHELSWSAADETYERYFGKLQSMGGIVEAFVEAFVEGGVEGGVEGVELRSPSVQMRITPTGDLQIVSTHDQILGGPTGQVYLGCRFPADAAYRHVIQEQALKIGHVLKDVGVVSRFGIDFVVVRDAAGGWSPHAIEINLRMGGTTHPFLGLQFLTGGELDQASGEFRTQRGEHRCYVATDSLMAPTYRGLLAEDLMDILVAEGLQYKPASETGTLFHMIGALSRYGKVGVTCIGTTRADADQLFDATVDTLDRATGATSGQGGRPARLQDRRTTIARAVTME